MGWGALALSKELYVAHGHRLAPWGLEACPAGPAPLHGCWGEGVPQGMLLWGPVAQSEQLWVAGQDRGAAAPGRGQCRPGPPAAHADGARLLPESRPLRLRLQYGRQRGDG